MVANLDFIKDVNDFQGDKPWTLKMRPICKWKLPSFTKKRFEPSMELVFIDQQCHFFHVDYMGLLTGKTELLTYTKNDQTSHYLTIQLDDLTCQFLGISAAELISSISENCDMDDAYPSKLFAIKEKPFTLKVFAKLENLSSYQPCVITISRLCFEPDILASFVAKCNIDMAVIVYNEDKVEEGIIEEDMLKMAMISSESETHPSSGNKQGMCVSKALQVC
ncbi:hypothetical protein AHAS_Ahas11G0133700 [Arachis hypogaea]